jgi:hypothetical protein
LITQLTTSFFEELFASIYNSDSLLFLRVDTVLASNQYQASIPSPEYNIYMAFNTSIIFGPANDQSLVSEELPPGQALLDIMNESIGTSYIVNYVWQATETPFISTQDVILNPSPVTENNVATNTTDQLKIENSKSEKFNDLQGRFILPGSKISKRVFRPDEKKP